MVDWQASRFDCKNVVAEKYMLDIRRADKKSCETVKGRLITEARPR